MENLTLITENMIGETKGTDLERIVKQNFNGETSEVGMSRGDGPTLSGRHRRRRD